MLNDPFNFGWGAENYLPNTPSDIFDERNADFGWKCRKFTRNFEPILVWESVRDYVLKFAEWADILCHTLCHTLCQNY